MESLPTWIGVLIGIVPASVILFSVKGKESWKLGTLYAGLMLVILATLLLGLMTDFSSVYQVLQNQDKINSDTASAAQSNMGLWVIMFPAIVGAIGANYITSWFQASKP